MWIVGGDFEDVHFFILFYLFADVEPQLCVPMDEWALLWLTKLVGCGLVAEQCTTEVPVLFVSWNTMRCACACDEFARLVRWFHVFLVVPAGTG